MSSWQSGCVPSTKMVASGTGNRTFLSMSKTSRVFLPATHHCLWHCPLKPVMIRCRDDMVQRGPTSGEVLHCHAQSDRVVGLVDEVLLGAKIPLGGLNRCVPQKQLDLLKLAACGPAELRARCGEGHAARCQERRLCLHLLKRRQDDLLTQVFVPPRGRRDSPCGIRVPPARHSRGDIVSVHLLFPDASDDLRVDVTIDGRFIETDLAGVLRSEADNRSRSK